MRTGAEYREALRDGRKVWVMGHGMAEDVVTHPATAAVVQEYVVWYDRLRDPAWADIALAPPDAQGDRHPWGYVLPRSAADLTALGRFVTKTAFLNAGNLTHTPAYGNLIALGVLGAAQEHGQFPDQIANAAAYRAMIARTGRFLTFSSGAPTIGTRMREDPAERVSLKLVKETDAGMVVSGRVGMHTSPAFAEDVYIGALNGIAIGPHRATFIVPIAAPGVTVICRKPAARETNPFTAPLSNRNDELDGQMWLDNVFVPYERVFTLSPVPEPIARWLFWHQLYCWLAKAEVTLGLALACTHALGLTEHPPTIELLMDLITDVQTVRTCQIASEHDASFTPAGYAYPNHSHVAVGSIAMLKARQHISEIMRILPGSSLVVAPTDTDLASPEVGPGLTESFEGGGYTALQRSALLQMAWDHVSSALDGRESAFELHANGGLTTWRGRLRKSFDGYNELANAVAGLLSVKMPEIDLSNIPAAPLAPRRVVTPRT
jgi:4-hydroxyphenylacetate 3-monooxygenase